MVEYSRVQDRHYDILYVDDEDAVKSPGSLFQKPDGNFKIDTASTIDDGLTLIEHRDYDAIIAGYHRYGFDGIAFLKEVRRRAGFVPFILFAADGSESVAMEAINRGVDFYVKNEGDPASRAILLEDTINRAISKSRDKTDNELRSAFDKLRASQDQLRENFEKLSESRELIRQSERQLADIINFLPDAMFAINKSGEVIAWNQAIEDMTGVPASRMIGRKNHEYALPFYGERRPLLIDLVFGENDDIKKHYPFVRKSGNKFISEIFIQKLWGGKGAYAWFISSPLYDAKGNVTGAIESVRDISEHKSALAARSESEARFHLLADAAQDGIFVQDNGIIRDINERAVELFGYLRDEMIGREIFSFIAPGSMDLVRHNIEEKYKKSFEAQGVRKDGTIIWTEMQSRSMVAGDRKLRITTFWDISERKRAMEELQKERGFTSAVMNSVPGLLYVYDKDGRLIRWNKAHETMTGYSADELSKMHLYDWYRSSEKDRTVVKEEVERAFKEGFASAEAFLETKAGTRIPMYFTAVRVVIDKKPYFVGIGIDITDRKQAESAIKEANKKLNILSSITRHDILNKLTALMGFLELAVIQPESRDAADFLKKAIEAADAIRRQIEFTRHYQDIGIQEPQWHTLTDVIQSALSQLVLNGIDVNIECHGFSVFADPLIEKVMYNLAENSLRHGGGVTRISFSAEIRGNDLVVRYTDNGCGITPEFRKRLFEKGFGKNTGLGLFLSREILAITGITITENGEPGQGVRFEIVVPDHAYRGPENPAETP